jgi:peptidyl-prolyl cis-trans isomerase D
MARRKEKRTEPTRKEVVRSRRVREQQRRLYIGLAAVAAALVLVLGFGMIDTTVFQPRSPVAVVEGTSITTQQFQRRFRYERVQLQNQLAQLRQLEAELNPSGQGASLFGNQIAQLEALLKSPQALGDQVLEEMINEVLIRQRAAADGLQADPQEVEERLQEIVASRLGFISAPAATKEAVAIVAATATAALWTPTPTATPSPTPSASPSPSPTTTSSPAVSEATPTPVPPTPTPYIMTDEEYQQELPRLADDLRQATGLSLEEFKELIITDILRQKVRAALEAQVPTTEEQVHVRHILIAIRTPTPTPESTPTPEASVTPAVAESPTPTPTPGGPTPTPTPAPRTEEEALARAYEVLNRLKAGEDFARLAAEYSDDPGSRDEGGDLGWFGRGRMVQEFEDAAFSLPVNQFSEPVKTFFGYHIIQVLARDPNHPLDEATLAARKSQAFDDWLNRRKSEARIERRLTAAKIPAPPSPR